MVVQGTGTGFSGGIGGPGTFPSCILTGVSPAAECRVYFDMTPVKRSPDYCANWPSTPPPRPEENLGGPPQGNSNTDNNPDKCNDPRFAANPVNVATGNKFESVLDLSVSTSDQPLVFRRFYNSQLSSDGPLGYGWTHSYDQGLEIIETSPTTRLRIWVQTAGRYIFLRSGRQTLMRFRSQENLGLKTDSNKSSPRASTFCAGKQTISPINSAPMESSSRFQI